jgi:hypothetical protein
LLVGVTVVGGAVMALFASPLGKLMTAGEVEPLLLLGWVAYLGVWRRACHTRPRWSPASFRARSS